MNTVVETINAGGRAFVDFALPMLIQSGVLILILLAVDTLLRRRVRAVVRYWIWMLVLVKLVLPPSLGSPVSLGTWFGDTLEVPAASLLEPDSRQAVEPRATRLPPTASTILAPPDLEDDTLAAIASSPSLTRVLVTPDALALRAQELWEAGEPEAARTHLDAARAQAPGVPLLEELAERWTEAPPTAR